MKTAFSISASTLAISLSVAVAQPPPADHRILNQPEAPIAITKYEAFYLESNRYRREGIRHELEYRNRGDRSIVAIRFGLLSFNIFNDFQDRLGGITIEDVNPGQSESGAWVANALAEASFYTGVAYVSKVRFRDGQIWLADEDDILAQIREIESTFSADMLE